MASPAPWTEMFTRALAVADGEIAGLIQSQRLQNEATVNLVASESYCPRATLEAEACALINKNSSGYPPRRTLGGSDILDRIENLANERARRLFGRLPEVRDPQRFEREPRASLIDASRARDRLGWEPTSSWPELAASVAR